MKIFVSAKITVSVTPLMALVLVQRVGKAFAARIGCVPVPITDRSVNISASAIRLLQNSEFVSIVKLFIYVKLHIIYCYIQYMYVLLSHLVFIIFFIIRCLYSLAMNLSRLCTYKVISFILYLQLMAVFVQYHFFNWM